MLYQRGTTYWCKWKIDGQVIRETTRTSDPEAAQEFHDLRRAELWRKTKLGEVPTKTWGEAALAWATEHAQFKKSYSTDYIRLAWLAPKLGHHLLNDISTDVILDVRNDVIEMGRAQATANRYIAVVSAVLNYAHEKNWVGAMPKIPHFKESKGRFLWITREQAQILLSELPPHLSDMAAFVLGTGLRRANVTGLEWIDVDLIRGVAWAWPDQTKQGKPLGVPLNAEMITLLGRRRGAQGGTEARWVFTYEGAPIFHTTTAAWHKACARAGVQDGFTFHDLRHTWASWHVMGGTSLRDLMELGGWASLAMVQRYAHLSSEHVAKAANNVLLGAQKGAQPILRYANA